MGQKKDIKYVILIYRERVIIISVYVMSDLHGCYEKYKKMLEKIKFNDEDTLYMLGDVVDRGDSGIKILQDMMKHKNIIPIRGNHDYLAYIMLKAQIGTVSEYIEDRYAELFQTWIYDGGQSTFDEFNNLDSGQQRLILSYLNSFLIYDEIDVNGKTYFLSHTVPEKERFLKFNLLMWQEFIVGEPEYEKIYCLDKIIITGHTPTGLIDKDYSGRIYKNNNHIAIDCGAVFDKPLGCIRLDDLEEFYVE